jgi:cysteinyl-tRNA synthetase
MKKFKYLQVVLVLIMLSFTVADCKKGKSAADQNIDYRQEMRNFIFNIGSYSKSFDSNFMIIPQNGQELITDNGEADGKMQDSYVKSVDATGREDLFYGFSQDDQPTPEAENQHMLSLCLLCEQHGVQVMTTDYCSTHSKMDYSYQVNDQNAFISFAASDRNLSTVPDYPATPFHVNSENIVNVSQAKNFLYLINSVNFATKSEFITAVSATDYDLIVMDLFHNEVAYTKNEIEQLKTKHNGGKRLAVCYLSIGEAENYRYYWQPTWNTNNPAWLEKENPAWPGNYKVRYWDKTWQNIIYGNNDTYLKKIIDAGFDGVYLDVVDAFEYFEEK